MRFERGAYDEPLGRRSDVRERITRHQRQRWIIGRIEHPDILRLDDAGALHIVVKDTLRRRHTDFIIRIDVAQLAEERIAMAGEANVSYFAR